MSWQADSATGEATADVDVAAVAIPAPRRPLLVEFGTAVLVVGGAFGVLQKVFTPLIAATAFDPLFAFLFALDAVSVIAGIVLRTGRSWIPAANVAAVYAFLHLATQTPTGVALTAVFLAVVVACFASREWFDAMRDWRVARFEARATR
ncbi:MAG TPA: hypothetical protein VFC71_08525 [Candidatus Polarisedimenticolia bacterium]|nr:hypothetical protein [Candidatus Polarisedimenticolia bacterium]